MRGEDWNAVISLKSNLDSVSREWRVGVSGRNREEVDEAGEPGVEGSSSGTEGSGVRKGV